MNTNENTHDTSTIQFYKSFVIIFLDLNVNSLNKNNQDQIVTLQQVCNNTVHKFIDVNQCINFLNNIKQEKAFLILTCDIDQSILSLIHVMDSLDSIYIYCQHNEKHHEWIENWCKIKGIYSSIESIGNKLVCDTRRWDLDLIATSIMVSTDDFNKLDQSLMYSQLLTDILRQIEDDHDQTKIKFVQFLRNQYADNQAQLKIVDEFEKDYHFHTPIWWYTRDIFIYVMINLALRTQNIDIIMKMAFFMRDLHQQIEQLYHQQFQNNRTLTVYRGQKLSATDFQKLQQNIGGILSFNNFVSTSVDQNIANSIYTDSAHQDLNMIAIIFCIYIDSSIDSAPFASIGDISYFGTAEEEILFSMHTIFRINDVKNLGDRLWEVQLTLTDNHDQQLKQLKQTIEQDIQGGTGWHRLGRLMVKLAKYDKAEEIYKILINSTSNNDHENVSVCYSQLGYINEEKGNLPIALKYYQQAQEIQEQYLSFDDPRLSTTYNNIGALYQTMRDYSTALFFMKKVQQIREKTLSSDDIKLGLVYNNIATTYRLMKNFTEAIFFYEKTLKIFQKQLSPIDPKLATCYSNIAEAYNDTRNFSRAIFFCEKVLEIQQRSLCEDHPDISLTYYNLGKAHQLQGNLSISISFYQKAIEIRKESSTKYYPDMILIYSDAASCFQLLGKYEDAIIFTINALEIQEKHFTLKRLNLVDTYNNLVKLHELVDNRTKLLLLRAYRKMIDITEHSASENYLLLFGAYNQTIDIYYNIRDDVNALLFCKRALEAGKKYLFENHRSIAIVYFNIATVLDDLEQYQIAIDSLELAIDIGQHCFESNHPQMHLFHSHLNEIRQKIST